MVVLVRGWHMEVKQCTWILFLGQLLACCVIPDKAQELLLTHLLCLEIKSSFLRNFLDLGLEVQQIITFTYGLNSVIKGSENVSSMSWVEE